MEDSSRPNAADRSVRCVVVSRIRLEEAGIAPRTVARLQMVRTMDATLALLDREAAWRSFTLDGQTAAVDDYLAIRPERRADVERLVRAGRLVVGPWFVPTDPCLVSGEALIRNLQHGVRRTRALGGAVRDAYMPLAFGLVAQLPQILRGFGLRSCVFDRGPSRARFDAAGLEFEWVAPDGSRVIALYLCAATDGGAASGQVAPSIDSRGKTVDAQRAGRSVAAAVTELEPHARAGVIVLGDGGQHTGARFELPRILDAARAALPNVEFVHGAFSEAVDLVVASERPLASHAGEISGSAHRPITPSAWSARMPQKMLNQRVESMLEKVAEPLVAALRSAGREHVAHLEAAWRVLLLAQASHSVRGTCVDAVAHEALEHLHEADELAQFVAHEALRALALSSGRTGAAASDGAERELIAVFNPHPEAVAEQAATEVLWRGALDRDAGLDFTLFDPDGRGVRVDVLVLDENVCEAHGLDMRSGTRLMVAFEARVPAFGVAFYELVQGPDAAEWRDEPGAKNTIENEHYMVEARRNGSIAITHKRSGLVYEDALVFEDQPDHGDLAHFAPVPGVAPSTSRGVNNARIETRDDPTGHVLSIEFEWKPDWLPRQLADQGALKFFTSVHLVDGIDRVDFMTEVATALGDHRLRVLLPVGRDVRGAQAGSTFGVEARARRDGTSLEDQRTPEDTGAFEPTTHFSRDYLHTEDALGGVLIAHRGLFEFELIDMVTKKENGPRSYCALTLIRGVGLLWSAGAGQGAAGPSSDRAGRGLATPSAQFVEPNELFEYSWSAVTRGIATAELAPRAQRFTRPIHVQHVWLGPYERPWPSPRPARYGVLKIDNPMVSLSAFKLDAAGRVIVRVWNRDSRPQKAMIALSKELCSGGPPSRADRCDSSEVPLLTVHLVGTIARVELGAHEIFTIAFTFGEET